jgi:hypothetical protein
VKRLRLASIRNRNCHLDNDLQHSAGTLKGLLKIFEGLPDLRVKVIVARKTKTPELIDSLPDRDTDTCRYQRLRLQPETSNESPRNDLLAARSRWP